MRKDTLLSILFFGVLACSFVCGRTIGTGDKQLMASLLCVCLSFFSMLIGMILWAIYSSKVLSDKVLELQEREDQFASRVQVILRKQRELQGGDMLMFAKALSKVVAMRVVSFVAPERLNMSEQVDAIIEEEVQRLSKNS